jgi:E3 ubiquitin-protein ligase HUWE1
VNLASPGYKIQVDELPAEAREVNYSFYRTDGSKGKEQEKKEMEPFDPSQSPARKPVSVAPATSSSFSGAINLHIDEQTLQSKSTMDVLADTIETYSVPDEEKFELMCRIRSAQVLTPGKEADREKLIIVRLLAVAIFGHTHSESQALASIFLYEPDLIIHIAEVLQIDRDVPVSVQTAAIASLDALARYRNKIQEALTAVNAGVNHGILMALVRKTVADVRDPSSTLPHSFIEALLSFVTFIASHSSGGNMVVGAGLVPLLIQAIDNRLPQRLPVVSKVMQLVDNVLYSFQNAFQLFCTAGGIEVLVDRIEVRLYLIFENITNRVGYSMKLISTSILSGTSCDHVRCSGLMVRLFVVR